MGSAHIPPPREDDPEEVADKLSIAAAMWARGETHDALQWLRRAAESASDADSDMRALELAKAAAELANAAPAAPAAPATTQQPPPRPMQTTAPTGVKPATPPAGPAIPASSQSSSGMAAAKHSAPPVKPASRPAPAKPSMRPGGPPAGSGKLAPLPPLRPLGTATAPPKPAPSRRPPEPPPSGTSPVAAAVEHAPAIAALSPLIDEAIDHDQTSVMPIADAQNLARMGADPALAPPSDDGSDHLETMRRDVDDAPLAPTKDDAIHVAETMDPSNPIFAQGHAGNDHHGGQAATHPEASLPLAVGIRVRVFATEGGAWIVPEHEGDASNGGTSAILVPVHGDDDLRSLFAKK